MLICGSYDAFLSLLAALLLVVSCFVPVFSEIYLLCYRYGALNVQAGTLFCDADFQKEVSHTFSHTFAGARAISRGAVKFLSAC